MVELCISVTVRNNFYFLYFTCYIQSSVFTCQIPRSTNNRVVINIKYGWNFNWPDISRTFLTTSTTNTQGQMLSVVKLSPDKQSCRLSQLYHEMVYRYSTIYILQLLQVPSDRHVTSILITLAQTIYNILYKVQQPK